MAIIGHWAMVFLAFFTFLALIWQGYIARDVGLQTLEQNAYLQFKAKYTELEDKFPDKFHHILLDTERASDRGGTVNRVSGPTGAGRQYYTHMQSYYFPDILVQQNGLYSISKDGLAKHYEGWKKSIEDYWNLTFDEWYFSTQFSSGVFWKKNRNKIWQEVFGPAAASKLDCDQADVNYGYYFVFCELVKKPHWPHGKPGLKEAFINELRQQVENLPTCEASKEANKDANGGSIVFVYPKVHKTLKELEKRIDESLGAYYKRAIDGLAEKYPPASSTPATQSSQTTTPSDTPTS